MPETTDLMPIPWATAKADDTAIWDFETDACPVCHVPFQDDDLVVLGMHCSALYLVVHVACNAGEPRSRLSPKRPAFDARAARMEMRESTVQLFGEDAVATWCPTCNAITLESRPQAGSDPRPVVCDFCRTTWMLVPPPAPPPEPEALMRARAYDHPGVAAKQAQRALEAFIATDDKAHLHEALVGLTRACQLLAHGQHAMVESLADLDDRVPDLDAPQEPVASLPPGVARKKREPLTAKTQVALAASAASKLAPKRGPAADIPMWGGGMNGG